MGYLFLADLLLIVHVLFAVFVIGGFAAVTLGGIGRWQWVRNFWFRITHLLAIVGVALQSWLGFICPLTTWENNLRGKGGSQAYQETFIAHWLRELLFFEAADWLFVLGYTLFGVAVLGTWVLLPPRLPWNESATGK